VLCWIVLHPYALVYSNKDKIDKLFRLFFNQFRVKRAVEWFSIVLSSSVDVSSFFFSDSSHMCLIEFAGSASGLAICPFRLTYLATNHWRYQTYVADRYDVWRVICWPRSSFFANCFQFSSRKWSTWFERKHSQTMTPSPWRLIIVIVHRRSNSTLGDHQTMVFQSEPK
jgi:hypothetical protein